MRGYLSLEIRVFATQAKKFSANTRLSKKNSLFSRKKFNKNSAIKKVNSHIQLQT